MSAEVMAVYHASFLYRPWQSAALVSVQFDIVLNLLTGVRQYNTETGKQCQCLHSVGVSESTQ